MPLCLRRCTYSMEVEETEETEEMEETVARGVAETEEAETEVGM